MSGAVAASVNRSFDANLRVTGLSVNGVSSAYGYDFDGLLTQAGALAITRDAGHGMPTGSTLGSLVTSQTYNGFGELANFSAAHGTTPLLSYTLGYDKGGRITGKTETVLGATTTYGYSYDAAGRLAGVSQNGSMIASYGYDANGNRTQQGGATIASVDAQDRLLSHGTASYLYTAHGSLREKTQGAQTTRYGYDAFGNLKSVELPSGGRIDYLVDGANRRIGKRINGTLVQGFAWQDQLRIAAELDGANNVVARFVHGERPNVPETMSKGGVTYRLLTDHLGSVRLVIDAATGAIAQRIDYDEWGRVTSDSNPGFQPFGYAGGLYDAGTGLVRFGARDYDAQTGRWTSKDPIRFAGGDANLMAYVEGNPISFTDPTGLETQLCSRELGGPSGSPVAPSGSPLRHDYLVVDGKVYSFMPGSGATSDFAWSQGRIANEESTSNGQCKSVSKDPKFDRAVEKAISEVGRPKYNVWAYPSTITHALGARNCQSWAADVLRRAAEKP